MWFSTGCKATLADAKSDNEETVNKIHLTIFVVLHDDNAFVITASTNKTLA